MTEGISEKPIVLTKTKRDTYIFNPKSYYHAYSSFRINKKIEIALTDTTEFKQTPTILESVYSSKVIDYYIDKDNVQITKEDYESKLNDLSKGSVYDESYLFNLRFENLEQEFAYRQYRSHWSPVHKLIKVYNQIPFVIKNEVISEYPEIVPFAQYGEDISDPTCRLSISPKTALNIAIEECNKDEPNTFILHAEYGKVPDGYRYGIAECSHSGIHYHKINGEFAFTREKYTYENPQTHNGSYEECVKVRSEYIKSIKTILEQFVFAKENKKLKENERIEVSDKLTRIYETLCEVDSMRKTEKQYYNAKELLRKLIEYIKTKK